jgi:ATP-dependent DNA helicase RecQ
MKKQILKHHFGYDEFRDGQEQAIDALLSGRDTVAVMPTGGGKSLCYQIPALMGAGVTLVISPLISLMQDQLTVLRAKGLPAAAINSTYSYYEQRVLFEGVRAGAYKLIYAAPERLVLDSFREFCAELPIDYVMVDEAHCISEWGHEFRPSYREIPDFINALPHRPVIGAFTATATGQVAADIVNSLGMQAPVNVRTSVNRPNLFYGVVRYETSKAKKIGLLDIVSERAGKSGIVYCMTKRDTDELAEYLTNNDINALPYHASIDPEIREYNQRQFLSGRVDVICATVAFGMGIDKADVRYVLHYGYPPSLERYAQESGRAGRDGLPSDCLILFSGEDTAKNEWLIKTGESDLVGKTPDERVRFERLAKHRQALFGKMKQYVYADDCYREHIARYFGESAISHNCGGCLNCNARANAVYTDITVETQKIVSCVIRLTDAEHFIDTDMFKRLILGKNDIRLRMAGLNDFRLFGIMEGYNEKKYTKIIKVLCEKGFITVRKLTKNGRPSYSKGARADEIRSKSFYLSVDLEQSVKK